VFPTFSVLPAFHFLYYLHLVFCFRVKHSSNKESSFQVSEFHVGNSDANKQAIHIRGVPKLLGQQGSHAGIIKPLRSSHRKAKTLPRLLEKPTAARVKYIL
jgi:hypothetical protein